jgi:hypothetical protein
MERRGAERDEGFRERERDAALRQGLANVLSRQKRGEGGPGSASSGSAFSRKAAVDAAERGRLAQEQFALEQERQRSAKAQQRDDEELDGAGGNDDDDNQDEDAGSNESDSDLEEQPDKRFRSHPRQ